MSSTTTTTTQSTEPNSEPSTTTVQDETSSAPEPSVSVETPSAPESNVPAETAAALMVLADDQSELPCTRGASFGDKNPLREIQKQLADVNYLPQPGDHIYCGPGNTDVLTGPPAAIVRRLVWGGEGNTQLTYHVLTPVQGSSGFNVTTVALPRNAVFTSKRRASFKVLLVGSVRIEIGDYYAFPNILCRCIGAPLEKAQYTLTWMPSGQYIWHGLVMRAYDNGVVIKVDEGLFFATISEIRNPVKLSESPETRKTQLQNLEKHYAVIQTICPGDTVIVCADRHVAAETNAWGGQREMGNGEVLQTVVALLFQFLDLPGTRAVVEAPDGTRTTVFLYNLALVRQVHQITGREKTYGGVPAYYFANRDLLTPDQPAGLQEPEKLTLGSIFVKDTCAYRVVEVIHQRGSPGQGRDEAPIGYIVTNARRHPGPPGFVTPNPLAVNNIWYLLMYVPVADVPRRTAGLTVPGPRVGKKRGRPSAKQTEIQKLMELKIYRSNINGCYTVADGDSNEFDRLDTAESAIALASAYSASVSSTTTATTTTAATPTAAVAAARQIAPAPAPMSGSAERMYI